jgi:DNA (cytosine-5)-methyltransferase 1
MQRRKMKFGSLFAGIGGIDLGLERAGMSCSWQVEIDEFCQKVLTKHWPDVPKYGDIRDVGKQNLETVDLIAGGFPCQPFSVAGKRRGTEDDRHLWPEMLRVISELKPTWVLGENVPGIIPIFLDQAISDLEGEGYTTEQFTIPACAFDAPHQRERLFIVGYTEHIRFPSARGAREGGNGSTPWTNTTGEPAGPSGELPFVAYSKGQGLQGVSIGEIHGLQPAKMGERSYWGKSPPPPPVCGVDDGIPHRMDRVRNTSKAVVPQVAEHIGRMILEVANDK